MSENILMHKAAHFLKAIMDRTGKPVTVLASDAEVDRWSLGQVAKGKQRLTKGMLEGIVNLLYVPDELKAALAKAYLEDTLPENARGMVAVAARTTADLREDSPPAPLDEFERALQKARELGHASPAFSRMLRNMINAFEGKHEPVA